MNKNIRRSIAIAAGVSGAWALGSAVASADELPAHSVSVPDRPIETAADADPAGADAQRTVTRVAHEAHGTVAHANHAVHAAGGLAGAVAQGVPGHAGHAGQTVHDTVEHGTQTVHAAVADPTGAGPGAVAHADGVVHRAASAAGGHPTQVQGVAQDEVDYLFGPLSAFAPELAGAADQGPAGPAPAHAAVPGQTPLQADAPVKDQASGQAAADGRRSFAAEQQPAAGDLTGAASGLTGLVSVPLQVVGDVMYIGQGVQADVLAGQVPDNVPADTARLVDHLVTGLSGSAGGGTAAGQAPGA